jgi:hypothetical protein
VTLSISSAVAWNAVAFGEDHHVASHQIAAGDSHTAGDAPCGKSRRMKRNEYRVPPGHGSQACALLGCCSE